jgi:hypothetical protein
MRYNGSFHRLHRRVPPRYRCVAAPQACVESTARHIPLMGDTVRCSGGVEIEAVALPRFAAMVQGARLQGDDGTSCLCWSRRVTRSPLPRRLLARSDSCKSRARSRRHLGEGAMQNRVGAACKRRGNFIAEVTASEEFPCRNRRSICKVTRAVSRDLERCQCVHGPIP